MSMDFSLFDFEIRINDVKYDHNLADDLRVDRSDLDTEFAEQPNKFAYYATLASLARHRELILKKELEDIGALVDQEKRAEAMEVMAQNAKAKYTEKMYENMVKTDERYQNKHLDYLEAKRLADVLHNFKDAFAQRKEMLISLGANERVGASSMRVLAPAAKKEMSDPDDRIETKVRRKPVSE